MACRSSGYPVSPPWEADSGAARGEFWAEAFTCDQIASAHVRSQWLKLLVSHVSGKNEPLLPCYG